ncbi:MAG: 3'(2'),5'-bisphosphate nucleotidase CysQ [Bacteroidetes bacterium]|nr:3'(2'),5'-bisphosphate nucleotidase CysQ [Bacteroidota bacterium]
MTREELLITAINAALKGGEEILAIYESDFAVERKEDKTPLTLADTNAHLAIAKLLDKTNLPVLSEEGKQTPYETRKTWKQFWMVDPLDGTREFVKRNGEFTVNIALIENGEATMGIIYVPVTEELYFSDTNIGAFKVTCSQHSSPITHDSSLTTLIEKSEKLPLKQNRKNFIVVGSRSHMSAETEAYMNELKTKHTEVDMLSKGSSLKLCMVAEGSADSYPRFAPTMEWDTAAGQAIAIASGADVINWETKKRMLYNKENLLNTWFLVERD